MYLQDNRGRKRTKLVAVENDDNLSEFDDDDSRSPPPLSPGDHSYGKDASICPSLSPDSQLMFGEDIEDNNSMKTPGSPQDPWMRRSAHIPSEPTDIPSKPSSRSSPSLSEMGRLGHRRTASECLTSATELMFSSSVDSLESLTFRNPRSPLSISIDESEPLPTHPSLSPETKRAAFNG